MGGLPRRQGIPEAGWNDAWAIADPDGIGPRVFLQRVPEGKVAKKRTHIHLNVSAPGASLAERKAQVDAAPRPSRGRMLR